MVACNFQYGFDFLPSSSFSLATHQLSSSTHAYGCGFFARDTNAITHLGFSYSVRTGTPPTYRISLQGIDAATGNPDGTVKGGGSPASATFTPPADTSWNSTWQWIALSNSYTPTIGEELAFVVDYSSGTVNTSNAGTFNVRFGTGVGLNQPCYFPVLTQTAGSWSKMAALPAFGVRTASTRYGNIATGGYNTRSASTVGHRVAIKLQIPSGVFTSATVNKIWFAGSLASAAGKNPLFKIWDTDGATVLFSRTLDSDKCASPASAYQQYFLSGIGQSLNAGSNYYAGLEVADAVNAGVLINGVQLAEAADRDSWGAGTSVCLSTYNGSAWTDDATVSPFMQIFFNDITAAGGSSQSYVIGG